MAKTKNNDNEDLESTVEELNDAQETSIPMQASVSSAKKKVKIRTIEEIDCLIACKHYKFNKDKDVQVPSDVAAILCYGGKAIRL